MHRARSIDNKGAGRNDRAERWKVMAMKTKHAGEPWAVFQRTGSDGSWCVIRPDSTNPHHRIVADDLSEAIAKQIVQDHNACAGMADPEAEIAALRRDVAYYSQMVREQAAHAEELRTRCATAENRLGEARAALAKVPR